MREENAKMKREIFELLHEAEELRKTIEDKELQLREFITEFHQQTKVMTSLSGNDVINNL